MGKFTKADYGILLVIGTLGIVALAVATWPHLINPNLNIPTQQHEFIARILLLLAALVTFLNIRIAWLRPLRHYLRHRSLKNFDGKSSISIAVGILLLAGSFLSPPSTSVGIFVLVVGLINPGGLHWAFLSALQMARSSTRE